jgi:LCP family protein required for cell wall assembly
VAGAASAGVLAGTVVAGSATIAADRLTDNLTSIDISHQVGDRPEQKAAETGPLTVLLMGSDARTGKGNTGYGSFEGARSDTTMLVHIYPDRDSALVLSIPRDTVTALPSCKDADGKTLAGVRDRFNTAFDLGGPGCTLKAVEKLTGLTVDHFVVLDFNGFKRTIDALGGVEVCLSRRVQDSRSGLDLPAGRSRVTGEDALSFVRARHNIGDGSDISRIDRQQLFLSSLIREVTSSGLLTDPLRLWRVLDSTSKSLATDPDLADTGAIIDLGTSLAGLRPDDITFVTLPWVWNPDDPNTVIVDQTRANPILKALRQNTPWPPPPTKGSDGKALKTAPADVVVSVRNGTGRPGQATAAANALAAQGFRIAGTSLTDDAAHTVIRHSPDQLQAARTLQAAVPAATLKEVDGPGSTLRLRLGADYSGITTIKVKAKARSATGPTGTGSTTDGTRTVTADQDICTS